MTYVLDAVYEHGAFRLLSPPAPNLHEGQTVRITVSEVKPAGDILKQAADVFAGLTQEEIDEIESVALDRKMFFTPDER
jgi:predicted DNA-binding antitoxin AbrB/MazE fold protein